MTDPQGLREIDQTLSPNAGVPRQQVEAALQKLLAVIGESLPMEAANKALQNISLANLFYHADAEDDIGLFAREAIARLLGPIPYVYIAGNEYKPYLLQGLSHFSPDVRKLSLNQVQKCLRSGEEITMMVKSEIFVMVLTTLSFQSSDVAQQASDLIYKLACTDAGHGEFFSNQTISILNAIKTIDDTIKFRVYELIVRVAGSSDRGFEAAEDDMLLDEIINEAKSADILIKINAIEMFTEIAATEAGFNFLKRVKLVEYLAGVMKNEHETESSLSVCSAIRFFGKLVSIEAVDINELDTEFGIMDIYKSLLGSSSMDALTVTIATIGLVGASTRGLLILHQKSILTELCDSFPASAGNIKVGYLQTFSQLLSVHDEGDKFKEVEHVTESIFQNLARNPVELLMNLANQPMEEMKIAAFAVFESVSSHEWGQKILTQNNKFLDYILNRTTESTHAGKTWKYSIVRALTMTPNASENIDPMALRRLAEYVKQGPFYIHREAAVAMESG
ncbi:hypothetical protein INT43_007149 [Umbelopsis isabellina]|uniref:26S proteasome non-ATPase regulatory subunit 5 n=1 Tax=Mortierella isabellina TaxID=91625 RepID=A0A8H7PXR1_MORIS|nr:hypothetical protein INT43_007149 [Umbelopsis isabellina]